MTTRTKNRRTDPQPEIRARLARIVEQHAPYEGSIDVTTGAMCRECGYLDPCPTKRMGTEGDPEGPWLGVVPGTALAITAEAEDREEEAEDGGEDAVAAAASN